MVRRRPRSPSWPRSGSVRSEPDAGPCPLSPSLPARRTDRKATVEKTISDKVAKRNANLAARKQQAKDKKMGVKAKGKGTGKKVSSSSGKARSKGRPGFEGGGRKKK